MKKIRSNRGSIKKAKHGNALPQYKEWNAIDTSKMLPCCFR